MKKRGIISIVIFMILLIFVSFVLTKYFSWKKDFLNGENVTCLSHEVYDEDVNIIDRVRNFVLSSEKVGFMTFDRREFLFLLKDSIQSKGAAEIDDMCLVSERGVWEIYIHPRMGILQLPWVGVDIVKDNRETVELYFRNIYVGGTKVPEAIAKRFLRKINKGISDGLLLVIENDFLGKIIQNIELLDDSIVIKGVE